MDEGHMDADGWEPRRWIEDEDDGERERERERESERKFGKARK
jgi:hypothetical protein